MWDIIKLPGGISDLLGRFSTQFFLYAWVGALIIAVLLSAVQLLTLRFMKGGWLYGLSYVPSCLLWLFLLDENALLGGVWAVLLTLLAACLFSHLSDGWIRRILLIAAIPVLYWMAGPVCVVFFLLHAPNPKRSVWYYGVFVLLAIMLVILAFYLPVPANNLWFGIHYYRYPTDIPVLLWAASLSVFILALAARLLSHWNLSDSIVAALCSFVLVAIGMGGLVWKNSNFKAEKVMHYDFMARHQQWNRILETINIEKPNNQIGQPNRRDSTESGAGDARHAHQSSVRLQSKRHCRSPTRLRNRCHQPFANL